MTQKAVGITVEPFRTVQHVCTPDGDAYKSFLTDPVWVTLGDPYPHTEGNKVEPLLTGEKYFKELNTAIQGANKTIYMLGWQINWDVHLIPGVRLYDALLAAAKAKPALKIYVLPWSNPSQVETHAAATVTVLNSINALVGGTPRVFAVAASAHPNSKAGNDSFFSHHQKQVVIDETVCFVGGIDVAYGRRDNESYNLNATGREGNDSYNGCLPHLKQVTSTNYVSVADLSRPEVTYTKGDVERRNTVAKDAKARLSAGRVQFPVGGTEIDEARQPRMPWQDVHLKVEGPAVSDLATNFVLRWNTENSKNRLALPPASSSYPKKGGCQVQMLRSASTKMVPLEEQSITKAEQSRIHAKFGHNHIHHAMVGLIRKADHFIYIENQFFTSGFGTEKFGDNTTDKPAMSPAADSADGVGFLGTLTTAAWGNSTALPENLICTELGNKLRKVIMNPSNAEPDGKSSPFHIYVTLPVHSEGMLNDIHVMTQVHYTMQSLVFGTQSLINRTRRAIRARQLWKDYDQTYERVFEDKNKEYEAIPIQDCWPYITLLNLRNWEQLGGRYVTEQIYIHTKMMVVDDRYALVGSANINDRSLDGDRDSEMAVLVTDTETATTDIGAIAGPQLTRKFARDLRMGVWNKIFALSGAKTSVKAASKLLDAVKKPAAQASWEAIRTVASTNTELYNAAFAFIPRNPKNASTKVSIWPTKYQNRNAIAGSSMPCESSFWTSAQHSPAAKDLVGVTGFITLLPWLWTEGENNNGEYHSALYTQNTNKVPHTPKDQTTQLTQNDKVKEKSESVG